MPKTFPVIIDARLLGGEGFIATELTGDELMNYYTALLYAEGGLDTPEV